jgi:hypothetical protein
MHVKEIDFGLVNWTKPAKKAIPVTGHGVP